MNQLKEQEIKVLEVNVEELKKKLEEIGASKIYEDISAGATLNSVSQVSENRVSYKLGKVDFDINSFPLIPPFLNINIESLEEEGYHLNELVDKLGLVDHQVAVMKIEDVYRFYGIDYSKMYKVEPLQEDSSETYKGPRK